MRPRDGLPVPEKIPKFAIRLPKGGKTTSDRGTEI
jgi:hypothetical protein